MAENKCISKICLIGFNEDIIKVVKDEEDEEVRDKEETKE